MDYKTLAEAALNRREALFAKRKAIMADSTKGADEKRGACAILDAEMDQLAADAREYVQHAERSEDIRGAHARAGALGGLRTPSGTRSGADESEWRGLLPSLSEYRALSEGTPADGGYTVPDETAEVLVDMLAAKAVLLAGIPADNVVRFTSDKFTLPVLVDSTLPALVAEHAGVAADGSDTFSALEFDAKKYMDIRAASNEILADSAVNLRKIVAQNMIRNAATAFDKDGFDGDGTTTPVTGIIGQSTMTATAALPTWEDVQGAVGRIWAGDGEPSVIWASPDAAIALENEREGTEGGFLNDAGVTAMKLPVLRSSNIPARTVIVADGSRIFAGVREDPKVAISTDARFETDESVFRLTFRAAGVYVVESSSVQALQGPAV